MENHLLSDKKKKKTFKCFMLLHSITILNSKMPIIQMLLSPWAKHVHFITLCASSPVVLTPNSFKNRKGNICYSPDALVTMDQTCTFSHFLSLISKSTDP